MELLTRSSDPTDPEIERRYVGAMLVLQAFADIQALRKAWQSDG